MTLTIFCVSFVAILLFGWVWQHRKPAWPSRDWQAKALDIERREPVVHARLVGEDYE